MRLIPITSITQSGANPGTFTVSSTADNSSGNWTSVFQGKYYRNSAGLTQPFYSSPTPPSGYVLIEATTFTVTGNASYSGRYTVFTKPSAAGLDSSTFSGGQTTIRVNEPIGAPLAPGDLTGGFISNVSTYYIVVAGESAIVVPPNVSLTSRPIDIVGRNFSGWGEIFTQNAVTASQNFAGPTAPASPFIGQCWFNTTNTEVRVWTGSGWNLLNGTVFASATSFRHTQSVAATTWTVNHNLAAASPFIVHASFFVDTGGGVIKPIIPSDVSYVNANSLTVTFTAASTGFALIRL